MCPPSPGGPHSPSDPPNLVHVHIYLHLHIHFHHIYIHIFIYFDFYSFHTPGSLHLFIPHPFVAPFAHSLFCPWTSIVCPCTVLMMPLDRLPFFNEPEDEMPPRPRLQLQSLAEQNESAQEEPLEPEPLDVVENLEEPLVEKAEPLEPKPLEEQQPGPGHCESPCPCCYYTISSLDEHGEFTPGWRKFGGELSWWHQTAPHAQPYAPGGGLAPGCNDPSIPRCACCYYSVAAGWPPGAGWYVGEWSLAHESYTWQWNDHGAPHRPWDQAAHWATAPEDANYMRNQQPTAPGSAPGSGSSSSHWHDHPIRAHPAASGVAGVARGLGGRWHDPGRDPG